MYGELFGGEVWLLSTANVQNNAEAEQFQMDSLPVNKNPRRRCFSRLRQNPTRIKLLSSFEKSTWVSHLRDFYYKNSPAIFPPESDVSKPSPELLIKWVH